MRCRLRQLDEIEPVLGSNWALVPKQVSPNLVDPGAKMAKMGNGAAKQ